MHAHKHCMDIVNSNAVKCKVIDCCLKETKQKNLYTEKFKFKVILTYLIKKYEVEENFLLQY